MGPKRPTISTMHSRAFAVGLINVSIPFKVEYDDTVQALVHFTVLDKDFERACDLMMHIRGEKQLV